MYRLTRLGKLILAVAISWTVSSATLAAEKTAVLESEAAPLPSASAKATRYAKRLLAKYDTDQSGHLSKEEWSKMHGRPERIDRNQDSKVTLHELLLRIVEYGHSRSLVTPSTSQALPLVADPANDKADPVTGDPSKASAMFHVPGQSQPAGLPSWFRQQDRNGDGQLSLAEYAPTSSQEAVANFERLDSNRDGLLTPRECVQPTKSDPAQGGANRTSAK
jgi:EF hand domain-containing protein